MKIFEVGRPNKKASLNLSINAIVVLILAITMLGLGLGFIRTMFKGATGKLSGAIESTSLKNPADSTTPLTIDRQITLEAGEAQRIEIGYYNAFTQENRDVALTTVSCDNAGVFNDLKLSSISAEAVPAGESVGFNAILETESVERGTFICQIKAAGSKPEATQTAQFFLEIVS